MKKTLLFSAVIATTLAANAEVFNYGFGFSDNKAMPFISELSNPDSEFYYEGNYDFIDKYGKAMPNSVGLPLINTPEGEDKGVLTVGLGISFLDGRIYKLNPDVIVDEEYAEDVEDMPTENYNYPFLSWGEKGVTRTVLMPGWGSEEGWEDKDYNGATAEDWIATKNGLSFIRLGTQNIVSRTDTYVQFPAVTGNVTVTVWAGVASDKSSKDQNLNVKITPVVDGVALPDEAVVLEKETGSFMEKRMYKMDAAKFDATGKNMAFQIGCNGYQLHLYYVTIEGEKADAAVAGIQATTANGAAYNMLGVQVDENYKGLVIKNGKKFVQK